MKYVLAIALALGSVEASANESVQKIIVHRYFTDKICSISVSLEDRIIAVPRPMEFCQKKRPGDLIAISTNEIEIAKQFH